MDYWLLTTDFVLHVPASGTTLQVCWLQPPRDNCRKGIRNNELRSRQSTHCSRGSLDFGGGGQSAVRRGARRPGAVRGVGKEPRAHSHLSIDAAIAVECGGGGTEGRGHGRCSAPLQQ